MNCFNCGTECQEPVCSIECNIELNWESESNLEESNE